MNKDLTPYSYISDKVGPDYIHNRAPVKPRFSGMAIRQFCVSENRWLVLNRALKATEHEDRPVGKFNCIPSQTQDFWVVNQLLQAAFG